MLVEDPGLSGVAWGRGVKISPLPDYEIFSPLLFFGVIHSSFSWHRDDLSFEDYGLGLL